MSKQDLHKVTGIEKNDMTMTEAFEVADPNHEFMVVGGSQPVSIQSFRHYGHPIRDGDSLWQVVVREKWRV